MLEAAENFRKQDFTWRSTPTNDALRLMGLGERINRFNENRDDSYLIHDPELIKQVFVREARYYTEEKHPYYNLKEVVSPLGGDVLRLKRNQDPKEIQQIATKLLVETNRRLEAKWDSLNGTRHDVYQLIGPEIVNLVLQMLFGVEREDLARDLFKESSVVEECLALQRRSSQDQQEISQKHEESRARMKQILREVFVLRLESLGIPLPEFMRNCRFDAPVPLTLTRTFLNSFAGVATTISWVILALAELQDEQHRLAELQDSDSKSFGVRLKALVNETLRLYPTAWMMTRTANSERELAGRAIKPGDDIHVCMYSLHRDPRFWEQAETFLVDRFIDSDFGSAKHPLAFLPFGIGPHRCVGAAFAMEIITSVIDSSLRKFKIGGPGLSDVEPFPFVALRAVPGSIAKFERREVSYAH